MMNRFGLILRSCLALLVTFTLLSVFGLIASTHIAVASSSSDWNLDQIKKDARQYLANNQDKSVDDEHLDDFQLLAKRSLLESGTSEQSLSIEKVDSTKIKVLIQFEAAPAFDLAKKPDGTEKTLFEIQDTESGVLNNQESVIDEIQQITGTQTLNYFAYTFNGTSIEATPNEVKMIKQLDGVKNVFAEHSYQPADEDANQMAQIQNVWKEHQVKGEGMVVAVLDTGFDPTHADFTITDPGKAKLNEKKVEDAIYGTPDTLGILRGKFFSDKFPFVYNYADGNTDMKQQAQMGHQHGQHVAGIISANGDADNPSGNGSNSIKGVAPEAQLLGMRIFSDNGGGATDESLIEAIDDSIKLGADVINLSLGNGNGIQSVNTPWRVAISKAANAGILPVVAAGNSHLVETSRIEDSTIGEPGIFQDSFTVASVNANYYSDYYTNLIDSNGNTIKGKEYGRFCYKELQKIRMELVIQRL